MMGTDILVAPQMTKGAMTRQVVLPQGTWRADDGMVTIGPARIMIETPLARLPYFERIGSRVEVCREIRNCKSHDN